VVSYVFMFGFLGFTHRENSLNTNEFLNHPRVCILLLSSLHGNELCEFNCIDKLKQPKLNHPNSRSNSYLTGHIR